MFNDPKFICDSDPGLTWDERSGHPSVLAGHSLFSDLNAVDFTPIHDEKIHPLRKAQIDRARFEAPRFVVFGDRSALAYSSLLDFSHTRPGALQPGGIVVPGRDIDEQIQVYSHMSSDPASFGATPILVRDSEDPSVAWHYQSGGSGFYHQCVPYDARRLSEPGYREELCRELAQALKLAEADIVFTDNFKVKLSGELVAQYPRQIMNAHNSVLPLHKGWRSENRVVNRMKFTEGGGYTLHLMDDYLDRGEVVFQMHIEPPEYDQAKCDLIGKEEYEFGREKQYRWDTMQAQREWVPKVLAIMAAKWWEVPGAVKVVEDAEAFAAEGRPGFEKSKAYQYSLEYDFRQWKKENPDQLIPDFEDWKANKEMCGTYKRMLFSFGITDDDGVPVYKTLESWLGSPLSIKAGNHPLLSVYSFTLFGDRSETISTASQLCDALFQGDSSNDRTMSYSYHPGIQACIGSVVARSDLDAAGIFTEHSVDPDCWSAEELSVHVKSERR